jgi:hypothetical protein
MRDDRHEQSAGAGMGAAGGGESVGGEREGTAAGAGETVLTLVCLKCGKEYFFSEEAPPAGMTCEKCGSSVFRDFLSNEGDEASDDFRDSTERDLDSDDAEGDSLPGDLIDLNRGG